MYPFCSLLCVATCWKMHKHFPNYHKHQISAFSISIHTYSYRARHSGMRSAEWKRKFCVKVSEPPWKKNSRQHWAMHHQCTVKYTVHCSHIISLHLKVLWASSVTAMQCVIFLCFPSTLSYRTQTSLPCLLHRCQTLPLLRSALTYVNTPLAPNWTLACQKLGVLVLIQVNHSLVHYWWKHNFMLVHANILKRFW